MKKELIICIIVIALVIIGNIVTQNYTEKCVAKINEELLDLRLKITAEEKNEVELKSKVENIKKDWDEMQEILAFYIEHDELEKVETQIFLLKGEMETKLYQEAIPEIEKCVFILEHIEDKTTLDVKNIF